jgi:competence protein ComFB
MAIKNLMEDIVRNTVYEVLKNDTDISQPDTNIEDIIAYVLNRIAPRYITSERGILHGKLEARLVVQQKTDIFLLIYEAIEVIKKRRATELGIPVSETSVSMCRFPHIIGEVLEETTFSIITDVEISLYHKDRLAVMIDSDWKNPYKTNKPTMGYYHFWPEYDEQTMGRTDIPIIFTIVFRHPDFKDQMIDIEIDIASNAGMGKSMVVPITLMQARDGFTVEPQL